MQFFSLFPLLHNSKRMSFISFFSTLLRRAARERFFVFRVCLFCMDRKKYSLFHTLYMCTYRYWMILCSFYACLHPSNYSHSGHFLQFSKCAQAILCKYLLKHFLNSFSIRCRNLCTKIKWCLIKNYFLYKIEIKRLVCG